MFDAVVVISLERRPERLQGFWSRLPADWPLPHPHVFAAVDGLQDRAPAWWKSVPGAWGCARSHHSILAAAAAAGFERILVLEDDVSFVPDFAARLSGLEVPADCEQLYLGGQHLAKPEPIPGRDDLVRGRNVNRTHAYGVIGRPAIEKLRDWIAPRPWPGRHHVDHRFGALHRAGGIRVYAVRPWLCGQAEALSDITQKTHKARSW
jgi:hypothetical protein